MDLTERAHSAIMGHLIGDAFISDQFRWSADSAVMLCSIASLNETDAFVPQDLAEKLCDLYIGSYLMSDEDQEVILTPVTCQALKNFSNSMSPDQCGLHEESADDYGAIIRVLPIALRFANVSLDVFVDTVEQSTIITHQSLNNRVVCTVLGLVFRHILIQQKDRVFDLLADYYKTKQLSQHLEMLKKIETDKYANQLEPEQCFWRAWDIFTKHQDDMETALQSIDPKDHIASPVSILVGSLIGISGTLSDIPPEWLRTIPLTTEIMEHITTFVDGVI